MHINQIDLIAAISSEVEKQIPGIPAEPRYMNAIIKAANLVCDEFKNHSLRFLMVWGLLHGLLVTM
nr:hypothetical protein [Providencia rettgeri]